MPTLVGVKTLPSQATWLMPKTLASTVRTVCVASKLTCTRAGAGFAVREMSSMKKLDCNVPPFQIWKPVRLVMLAAPSVASGTRNYRQALVGAVKATRLNSVPFCSALMVKYWPPAGPPLTQMERFV